jgi:hypothetical protein
MAPLLSLGRISVVQLLKQFDGVTDMNEMLDVQFDLSGLNLAQLKQLLGRILLELTPNAEPLILNEAEMKERLENEGRVIEEAAGQLPSLEQDLAPESEEERVQAFIAAVGKLSLKNATIVREAVEEVRSASTRLDFGVSLFVLNALVLAIAGAIVRPTIEYDSETKGGATKKKFRFKLQGVPKIASVIKAALPFLTPRHG